jgi:hypothetical protein
MPGGAKPVELCGQVHAGSLGHGAGGRALVCAGFDLGEEIVGFARHGLDRMVEPASQVDLARPKALPASSTCARATVANV